MLRTKSVDVKSVKKTCRKGWQTRGPVKVKGPQAALSMERGSQKREQGEAPLGRKKKTKDFCGPTDCGVGSWITKGNAASGERTWNNNGGCPS